MGLSASQARLLSLTSRQHTLEGKAQAIMANKLRLSNQADTVYNKYLAALDDTRLKTSQITEKGDRVWIDGNVNNLLRYKTDEKTGGSVFYVQDLASGKLYIPTELGQAYDNSTDYRSFVQQFEGITYKQVDNNAYILEQFDEVKDYEHVLASTQSMSETILNEYYSRKTADDAEKTPALTLLSASPQNSTYGQYIANESHALFINEVANLIASSSFESVYTQAQQNLFKGIISLYNGFTQVDPVYSSNRYESNDESWENYTETKNYDFIKYTVEANGKKYIETDSLDDVTKISMLLTGGTQTWIGKEDHRKYFDYKNSLIHPQVDIEEYNDYTKSVDIYRNINVNVNGVDTNMRALLNSCGYNSSNVGYAITNILTNVVNKPRHAPAYLSSRGLTEDDILNYEKYRSAYQLKLTYSPDYEWVPSNASRADYYEQIYNSIKAAGGWIDTPDAQAKNGSWVSNMIKSNQVILTSWDSENEMLSTTSSSLHVDIREVTDENYIEKISSDYDTAIEEINVKDTKFDKQLSTLETERTAIQSEIDSLKQVMDDNIQKYFKVFT